MHYPTRPPFTPERTLRVQRPIEAHYSVDGSRVPARVEDLSEGGAYIDTPHPLPSGTPLTLELAIPRGLSDPTPDSILLPGTVVWSRPGLGGGIAFTDLTGTDRERLRLYVAAIYFGHA